MSPLHDGMANIVLVYSGRFPKMPQQPIQHGPNEHQGDENEYHVVARCHGDEVEWAIGFLDGAHLLRGRTNPGQATDLEKSGTDFSKSAA